MATLYSISGLFDNLDNQAGVFFGGFFLHGSGVSGTSSLEKNLRGMLVDEFGLSNIRGELAPEENLEFEKTYRGRKEAISYTFQFDSKNNLWRGKYSYSYGLGEAACTIHSSFQAVEIMQNTARNIESDNFISAMIDEMVRKGHLVEVKP